MCSYEEASWQAVTLSNPIKSTHDEWLDAYANLVHNKTSLISRCDIEVAECPYLPANCSANWVAAYLKSPGRIYILLLLQDSDKIINNRMGEGSRDESGH
ncbi:hypothetical protein Pelo_821 [Pelomyxa schiedti]|nr:hypothetical protein Pelo_821 [Pelomyxa schiedti]